jgi:hypothetical protein
MNVSHVAEYRFYDLSPEKARDIDRLLTKALLEHGYQFTKDYDSVFRPAGDPVTWESRQEEDDKPTSKQMGFARKLWVDLKVLIATETNIDLAAKAQDLLMQVREKMKDPEVTRKTASETIGVLKEAIDELTFSQKGITTNEWK